MTKSIFLTAIMAAVVMVSFPVESFAQVQLIEEDQLHSMLALLPDMEDSPIFEESGQLQAIITDPTTIWYTHKEMPPAYQIGAGIRGNQPPLRFADPKINVSDDVVQRPDGTVGGEGVLPDGKGGNANIDFPWALGPGGTARSVNVRDFKGMWLPKKDNGDPWPVVYYNYDFFVRFPNDNRRLRGWDWVFPVDTVFIEVLVMHYKGKDYVFEIRVRRRERGDWDVDLYRPFDSPQDLEYKIRQLAPGWDTDRQTRKVVRILRDEDREIPVRTLTKTFEGERSDTDEDDVTAFSASARIDPIPRLASTREEHDQLTELLLTTTTFKSVLEIDWVPGNDDETCVFHIVPPRYDGAFAGKNRQECNSCHKHTCRSAREFDLLRGWYAMLRGNRGKIFSFCFADPESYVGTAMGNPFLPAGSDPEVKVRPEFLAAGVVEKFDKERHPKSKYHILKSPSTK